MTIRSTSIWLSRVTALQGYFYEKCEQILVFIIIVFYINFISEIEVDELHLVE